MPKIQFTRISSRNRFKCFESSCWIPQKVGITIYELLIQVSPTSPDCISRLGKRRRRRNLSCPRERDCATSRAKLVKTCRMVVEVWQDGIQFCRGMIVRLYGGSHDIALGYPVTRERNKLQRDHDHISEECQRMEV